MTTPATPPATPGPAPATRRAARAATQHGRAGRNLPAAVGVGLGLGAVVLASLLIRKEAFVAVVVVAVVAALWELGQALRQRDIHVPVVPVAVGTVAMLVGAYTGAGQALAVCFLLTVAGVMIWRTAEGGGPSALRDVAGGTFAAAYVPLLAGFAILMLAEDDGPQRIITFIVVTICSDVGGYAAGVLFGRHPMAPTVSPKKSWEGFGGSVLFCAVSGVLMVWLVLGGPWWAGLVTGLAVVLTATLGDLGESMLKRDLGIKDMGSILPGHGGLMDRLDSLLLSAPVVWLALHALVPPG